MAAVNYQLAIANHTPDVPITIKKVWYKHKNSSWERLLRPLSLSSDTFEPGECTAITSENGIDREECQDPSEFTGKGMHYSVANLFGESTDTHRWKVDIYIRGYGELTVEGEGTCSVYTGESNCTSTFAFGGDSLTIGDTTYSFYLREGFDSYSPRPGLPYAVYGATLVPSESGVAGVVLDYWQATLGNSAFYFDGIDDYISFPDQDEIDFGPDNDFTVSVWVNAEDYQPANNRPANAIVEKWSGGNSGYPYIIRYLNQTGKVRVARYDRVNNPAITSTMPLEAGWNHIEFTKFGKDLKLYINGVLDGTTTDTTTGNTTNSSPIYIGRRGGSMPTYFSGTVDELRIYPYATTEIREMQTIRSLNNDVSCMLAKDIVQGSELIVFPVKCEDLDTVNTVWMYDEETGYIHLGSNTDLCMHKQGYENEWENGRIIHLWACDEGPVENKSWDYDSSTGIIKARYNPEKCMHKKYSAWPTSGLNPIHVWDYCDTPTENNTWIFPDFTMKAELQTIRSLGNDGTCMGSDGTSQGSPISINVNVCDDIDSSSTTWKYDETTGYIHLGSNTDLCMHKQGYENEWENGRIIHLWACDEGPVENKSWDYDSSTGIIKARYNPEKCMHKEYSDWRDGNPIHIWSHCDTPTLNNSWIFDVF
ncbi:MAG: LamG-like jellyroll fold domain-containing protein [Candidatus Electrothrix aestuarii]|uniref:LamG-like jellyroll fold domain-containing protein n=1 Tax=Candidatus Electrothrix aestuarii TaxID=3062594 RepID=A0AAU8LW41_9BACT|nr:LamG-like jellyroll fold domain-containing protein [Candidatus Electrothrix aestuarii]